MSGEGEIIRAFNFQPFLRIGIAAVILFVIFVSLGKMIGPKKTLPQNETASSSAVRPVEAGVPAPSVSAPAPSAEPAKKDTVTPFNLTLKARGNVWIQVLNKGKTVFVGVLNEGEAKTIMSKDPLTVWTGKGEYLDFTVNGAKIGRVADGVVKNIEVSKDGIKLGGKIVKKF